jgi:hypothetical protein
MLQPLPLQQILSSYVSAFTDGFKSGQPTYDSVYGCDLSDMLKENALPVCVALGYNMQDILYEILEIEVQYEDGPSVYGWKNN